MPDGISGEKVYQVLLLLFLQCNGCMGIRGIFITPLAVDVFPIAVPCYLVVWDSTVEWARDARSSVAHSQARMKKQRNQLCYQLVTLFPAERGALEPMLSENIIKLQIIDNHI